MSDLPTRPSTWIIKLQQGEEDGLEELWKRFFERLVGHAEANIGRMGHNNLDEEAVTCSVFESIWRAARSGRLATIKSTDELWWWLLSATRRKIIDHKRRENAQKRKPQQGTTAVFNAEDLTELLSSEPDPQYMAILAEEYELGIAALDDHQLREIAVMKLSGASNEEIREHFDVAPATVSRKLRRISEVWAARGQT